MFTFFSKDADYSGSDLNLYVPPVSGASVAAFVGDAKAWSVNFGDGGDLDVIGTPVSSETPGIRQLNPENYIKTGFSSVLPESTYFVAARYTNANGQQSGVAVANQYSAEGFTGGGGLTINHVAGDIRISWSSAAQSDHSTQVRDINTLKDGDFIIYAVTLNRQSDDHVVIRLDGLSDNINTSESHDFTMNNVGVIGAEDKQYSVCFGNTPYRDYKSISKGGVDLGFVGIWPRALSRAEIEVMYRSVSARLKSLGVTSRLDT